jgi:hypothetical protein
MFLIIFFIVSKHDIVKQHKLKHNHGDGSSHLGRANYANDDRTAKASKEDIMLAFEKR